MSLNILIIAGEESGDLHGGNLVKALKEIHPDISFKGIGGEKMRRAGVETIFGIENMGTVGLAEIFGSLFFYINVYRVISAEIAKKQFDAAIFIDYPTLNMMFAKLCSRINCPAFFFISPQIWAWRSGRIKKIRRIIKKMYVVLPFEEPIYKKANVPVEFVGHPFVEIVKPTLTSEEAKKQFGLAPEKYTVGILPGSRKSEIEFLLDPMLQAAKKIQEEIKDCQFVLPIADSIDPEDIKKRISKYSLEIKAVQNNNYNAMNCSDCLMIASGSATLEAGLLNRPMVIIYKLKPLTYWAAKQLVKIKNFGLVNIVAGETVVPELLQHEVTPENISEEVLRFYRETSYREEIQKKLSKIRDSLGEPGFAIKTAQSICKELGLPV